MSATIVADHFAELWALGYRRLCPIIPPGAPVSERSSLFKRLQKGDDARGKMPGVRWPDGSWSGFDFTRHESAEHDLERWHAMGAGAGVKTGRQADGTWLVMIDADTLDESLAKVVKDEVETRLGKLPIRIGRYPKAGYLVRVAEEFIYARVEFGERDTKGRLKDRVEILSEGRQFVAYGTHPGTRKPYWWPTTLIPFDELPTVSGSDLVGLLDALRPLLPAASEVRREGYGHDGEPIDQGRLTGDPDTIRQAIASLPNTSDLFPTREAYLKIGYGLRAALPDDPGLARDLFLDWAARWIDPPAGEGNDPDIAAADFDRMQPPYRTGAPTLYRLAEQHSGGAFRRSDRFLDSAEEAESAQKLFEQRLTEAGGGLFGDAAGSGTPRALAFTSLRDAAESALSVAARPLVKGLLDQGAMTILYGASNVGKTFVAMDLAHAIAAGRPWGGMKTATGFGVVYVAAEGGTGARKRAAALRAKYGAEGDDRFVLLLSPVNLLRADADLKPLIDAIRAWADAVGFPVGLIVIDTLSRAMSGGDENSSVDMGAMVRHLDVLRKASGAHVMAVHHSGKDAARGARGWSGLRAATDTELEVADGVVSVGKQRDLDGAWSSAFVLEVVRLGTDEDGDPVTSCTVGLVGEKRLAPPSAPTAGEAEVLRAMIELEGLREGGEAGVAPVRIGEKLGKGTDKASASWSRAMLSKLVAKRLVRKAERGFWTVCPEYLANPDEMSAVALSVARRCAPLRFSEGDRFLDVAQQSATESATPLFE